MTQQELQNWSMSMRQSNPLRRLAQAAWDSMSTYPAASALTIQFWADFQTVLSNAAGHPWMDLK